MTRHQRAQFITDLMDSMKSSLLNKAERMPDDWDGFELRQYIQDFVTENAIFRPMDRKRAKAYRNTVLVNNL
jgi:hypothetical protein